MEFQQTGKELMEQLQGFNGRVEAELKTLRDEYRMCPRGELYIRKKRGREYFYEKCREGERSVSGNREKVSKLVRKRVLEHEIRCREIVAENLETAIRSIRIAMVREERKNRALTMKRIYSSGKVSMPDFLLWVEIRQNVMSGVPNLRRFMKTRQEPLLWQASAPVSFCSGKLPLR